jgi:uncharacterized protein YeaC (DUF1315 family)
MITLQKVMKYDSAQNASDARRWNQLKGQSSKSYRNQTLSAFGFKLSALMQRSR